jgi:hypothetical protein
VIAIVAFNSTLPLCPFRSSCVQGYGVIIIQGVEAKLKEAKVGDMVTVEKLKSIDEKNVSNRLSPAPRHSPLQSSSRCSQGTTAVDAVWLCRIRSLSHWILQVDGPRARYDDAIFNAIPNVRHLIKRGSCTDTVHFALHHR